MKFEKNLVGVNRMKKEDMISQLPNCLLSEILMKLPTKDVVKTSVLCRRWRYLWQSVSELDMEIDCFRDHDKLSFLDKFIELKGDLCLQRAKLRYVGYDWLRYAGYDWDSENKTLISRVILQKIQHLDIEIDRIHIVVKIPPTIYTSCERLVSLKIFGASLPKVPMSVSLPCLKIMDLREMVPVDSLDIQKLISVCPALETLTTDAMCGGKVSSQSLLSVSFTIGSYFPMEELVFETPKLKSLKLHRQIIQSIIINDMRFIVKLHLEKMFYFGKNYTSFLPLISCVRDLTISFDILEEIQEVLRSKSLPKFHNLSILRVKNIMMSNWEHVSMFLESCPNLKSLFLEFDEKYHSEINLSDVPQCVSSSLEFVEVKGMILVDMKKLGRYFMTNLVVLKKLTLVVDDIKATGFMKLEEFLTSSRRSKAIEVVVLTRTFGT